MLPSILQCTGELCRSQNYPVQNMNSAKVSKFWFKVICINLTGRRKFWRNVSCILSNYHYIFILNFLTQNPIIITCNQKGRNN